MKIEQMEITVRELVDGYTDDGTEGGVIGYGGRLDIRPPYQREFVYKDKQRDAVIHTVRKGFPLNTMYWSVSEDGERYEIIDGQQRTISLAQYVNSEFSIDKCFFHNLTKEEKEQILDYPLMIFGCQGTERERLDWFSVINIAGEELTPQELRNAVYSGPWLSDAKAMFSKHSCAAVNVGSDYMKGSAIRQEYLETAIKWVNDGDVEGYMSLHQHDPDAKALWDHFRAVIKWIERVFTTPRPNLMKGLDWGRLYREHRNDKLNAKKLEEKIQDLLQDDDVTRQKGIYEYLLTGKEKHLSIKCFPKRIKLRIYTQQEGICANKKCDKNGEKLDITQMDADHIVPWSKGGRTVEENCRLLCKFCNTSLGNTGG